MFENEEMRGGGGGNWAHSEPTPNEGWIVSGQYAIFYWVLVPWWIIMGSLVDFIYYLILSL
jgi:hypothetical protein